MMVPIGMTAVEEAARRIAGQVLRTPLLPLPRLSSRSAGRSSPSRSICRRPAASSCAARPTRYCQLDARNARAASSRSRPAITAARSPSWRAASGIACAVCMSAPGAGEQGRGRRAAEGAEVRIIGRSQDEAQSEVDRLVGRRGLTEIPPFDDPAVIAGQGTIGCEILADLPGRRDRVLVPLSGGGLIAGIALAVKTLGAANPRDRRLDGARRGDACKPSRRPACRGRGAGDAGRFPGRRHRPRQPLQLCHGASSSSMTSSWSREAEIAAAIAALYLQERDRLRRRGRCRHRGADGGPAARRRQDRPDPDRPQYRHGAAPAVSRPRRFDEPGAGGLMAEITILTESELRSADPPRPRGRRGGRRPASGRWPPCRGECRRSCASTSPSTAARSTSRPPMCPAFDELRHQGQPRLLRQSQARPAQPQRPDDAASAPRPGWSKRCCSTTAI